MASMDVSAAPTGIVLGRCCECGVGLNVEENPSSTCAACLRNRVDIGEGVCCNATIFRCRRCERYCGGGAAYITADLESRELLALCLKRVRGLKRVTVADAAWIWTEPHSMRLKVALTVQKEINGGLNAEIFQQALECDFVVRNQQCPDCAAVFNNMAWTARVQVRQRVDHKRTFFYLEQVILKKNAQSAAVKIEQFRDGLDFFFKAKNDAVRFCTFLGDAVPTKVKETKKLVSADPKSNLFNHQYTSLVELAQACKDDLVLVDERTARRLGDFPRVLLVRGVAAVVRLVDPRTGRAGELNAEAYWKRPPTVLVSARQLRAFVVLDAERLARPVAPVAAAAAEAAAEDGAEAPALAPASKKRRRAAGGVVTRGARVRGIVADVTLARECDLGANDDTVVARTHLGALCRSGDRFLGYDLRTLNLPREQNAILERLNVPDVVLVRKDAKQDDDDGMLSMPKRGWRLDALDVDVEEDNCGGADADAADREIFEDQLAADREMRAAVNLYRDGDVREDADDEDAVRAAELLDAVHIDPNQAVEDGLDDETAAALAGPKKA